MITILTEPSPKAGHRIKRSIKKWGKKILGKPDLGFSGHYAVTRSLVAGLDRLGVTYQYNPASEKKINGHVHVLAGLDTLRYAIEQKRKGRIRRLTAGPNIVVSSVDHGGIVASKEIDRYFVNSDWTMKMYVADNPALKGRIDFFPAGIDEQFWTIEKKKGDGKRLLFYKKSAEESEYDECLSIARKHNYNVREIIYGNYILNDLKAALGETDVVIFFSASESQGIALQEIWATDTPSMVREFPVFEHAEKKYESSSAPYLVDKSGLFFRSSSELEELIIHNKLDISLYSPRQYVLENLTDKVCAKIFLEKIGYEA